MYDFILMLISFIKNSAAFLTAFTIICAFLYRMSRKIEPYINLTNKIDHLSAKVNEISKEFKPNHGSSLRDRINNIGEKVEANTLLTKSIFCRQRWMLENKDDPIFEASPKGEFTWVNEGMLKITERGVADLMGHRWKSTLSEEHRDAILHEWENCVLEKRNFEKTIFITSKSGDKYSAYCVANIQEDESYIGSFLKIEKIIR